MLPLARMYLVLAGLLVTGAFVAASAPPGFQQAGFGKTALFQLPSAQGYRVEMALTGAASSQATAEAYALSIDLTGTAQRDEPRTAAQQEQGPLDAYVKVVDPARNTVIDAFTATASYAAHRGGLNDGTDGWAFTIDLHGADGLALWLHGNLTGLQAQDGHSAGLADAGGFIELPDGSHAASRFDLSLAGHATEDRVQ